MKGRRVAAERPATPGPTSRRAPVLVPRLDRAACAGHPTPQLWDRTVAGETKTQRTARKATAATICSGCPERHSCPSMIRPPGLRRSRAKTATPGSQRRCPECGTGFAPRDHRQRFCATRQPSCRRVARDRERAQQRRDADVSAPPAACPCGVELTAEQRERRIKYHDPECRRRAVNQRAAAYRASHRPAALPTVRCSGPDCEIEFAPLNSRHRYHDPRCWGRARRDRQRAETPPPTPTAEPTTVRCARCPVEFVPRDPRHRYHDPRCARAHANELRKARYQAAVPPVPPVDRQAVLAVIHGQAPLTSLPHPHRWLPVRYLRRRDLSVRLIAQQVRAGPTTVQRILGRAA